MNNERRTLCKAGLALGCAAVLPACGGSKSGGGGVGDSCPTDSMTGSVGLAADAITVNDAVQVMAEIGENGMSLIVCRDNDGYYALDGACTHMGCDVAPAAEGNLAAGFKCPCHGATFDANGANTMPNSGSTTPLSPLLHYAICFQPSGEILVTADPKKAVDASKRYKP